jgi:hypothetical protein
MLYKDIDLEECIADILYFFDFYAIKDIEELLWDLLSYALTCSDIENWEPQNRGDILHFFRLLTKLITGLYVLLLPVIDGDEVPLQSKP